MYYQGNELYRYLLEQGLSDRYFWASGNMWTLLYSNRDGTPVMLCFADCVPVVLVAPGGFAVVHSGWKGTIARISAKACQTLCKTAGCKSDDISAYIGPHILGDEYEVSQELMDRFAAEFACIDASASRMLDLSAAIREALMDAGVEASSIVDTKLSTVRQNDRFYSYRNEGGTCGRHAAIGVML